MSIDIDAVNGALQLLGEPRLLAVDASSKAGREVTAAFARVRDRVLREHPWNFAMTRAQIAASGTVPAFGWSYAYPMPADFLRLWTVDDLGPTEWVMESGAPYGASRAVLADVTGPLKIRYAARVTDFAMWDPAAVRVMELRLAMQLAETLPQFSSNDVSKLASMLDDALRIAKRTDAMENPPQDFPVDDWVLARL